MTGQDETPTGKIYSIQAVPNQTVEFAGNLSDGQIMNDLSWAWASNNACFPATQKQKFTGNHVLYVTEIPKYSEMVVTVEPIDPKVNLSIYAYQTGVSSDAMVPNLASCVRCECDHKWDRDWVNKTQDHTRTVKDLVAINRPYRVVIAVVGAEGLTEADYKLSVTTTSR